MARITCVALFVLLMAGTVFGQGTTFPVINRNGQPMGGASVAVCTGSNPGTSPTPCSALATTYTDQTLGTPCTNSPVTPGPTYGAGCTNPGLTDQNGNAIMFAQPGGYWAQIYGYQITTAAFPFTTGSANFSFAAPPPIGSTTPNTGAFTTLTETTDTISNSTSTPFGYGIISVGANNSPDSTVWTESNFRFDSYFNSSVHNEFGIDGQAYVAATSGAPAYFKSPFFANTNVADTSTAANPHVGVGVISYSQIISGVSPGYAEGGVFVAGTRGGGADGLLIGMESDVGAAGETWSTGCNMYSVGFNKCKINYWAGNNAGSKADWMFAAELGGLWSNGINLDSVQANGIALNLGNTTLFTARNASNSGFVSILDVDSSNKINFCITNCTSWGFTNPLSYVGTTAGLVGNGTAVIPAKADQTALGNNLSSTALYSVAVSVPSTGMFRASCYVVLTRAATSTSTLPACSVAYSDADTSTSISLALTNTSTSNVVGTNGEGTNVIRPAGGTSITYSTSGYATSGATSMQYAVHVVLELL